MDKHDLVERVLANWDDRRNALLEAARFVTWYDALPVEPHGVNMFDLSIPAYLDAVPNFKILLRTGRRNRPIVEQLREATDALASIPDGVELWDWELDEPRLVTLFQATTGSQNRAFPGFGPAMCTKLLHRKRPLLIPIIDSFVWADWTGKDLRHGWTTRAMVGIVRDMRETLPSHIESLDGIRTHIRDEWGVNVSRLRAYDIASYFWHSPPG